MKRVILGTAGHIDHGKTLLVKALTGVDTDRLPEEKKRGITIDIGFANLSDDDVLIGIVDVPGHERFIRNMVSGVSAIDFVLLVVAADDGIMPQTREHFDVVNLLGIRQGLVALTKIDLVDSEMVELIHEEINEFVKGTFLEGKPVLEVSARSGAGVEALRREIFSAARALKARETIGPFRMPIDRAFILEGIGTVVTGTVVSGSVKVGDTVEILPGAIKAKVRSIQVHGKDVQASEAGARTAINLPRIPREDLDRGQVVGYPDYFKATYMADARLNYLPSAPKPLKSNQRVRLLSGTFSVVSKIVILEKDELKPGESGFVQFRTEHEVVCERGDRFIARMLSPEITLGGGTFLETHPLKHRRKREDVVEMLKLSEAGRPDDRIEQALKQAGYVGAGLEALAREAAMKPGGILPVMDDLLKNGRAVLLKAAAKEKYYYFGYYNNIRDLIESAAGEFHKANPFSAGVGKEEIRSRLPFKIETLWLNEFLNLLEKDGKIKLVGDRVSLPGHEVEFKGHDARIRDDLLSALESQPFSPPDIPVFCQEKGYPAPRVQAIAAALAASGRIVRISDSIFLGSEALGDAVRILEDYMKDHETITPSELKTLLNTTRKYIMPLLEYLDGNGITRRIGDARQLAAKP